MPVADIARPWRPALALGGVALLITGCSTATTDGGVTESNAYLELALIVVLVLFNGVFSATEIALVTLRRSRLQQLVDEGHGGAARVLRLKLQPGRFLAVIQIGINFLGFLASAFAAVSLVDGMAAWLATLGPLAGSGEPDRPRGRDRTPDDLHDHLRRARAQADRPGACGAGRVLDEPPHRRAGRPLRSARGIPDLDDPPDQPAVRRRCRRRRADQCRGAAPDHRAGWGTGHPGGRRGADDPRGHRARRPAHPRGHGPAHRDGHAAGDRLDGRGDRHRHRGRPQPDPGLRGDHRRDHGHPLRQGPAAVPEGFRRRSDRRSDRSCARPCSSPSR